MAAHLAIGIDVGYSATRRSTGVVFIDRETKTTPPGCPPVVATAADALTLVEQQLARLKPTTATICVDGSFAPPVGDAKVRHIERFFKSGPFSSTRPPKGLGLRISPAPTAAGSKFLASTVALVAGLSSLGFRPLAMSSAKIDGHIVEIFPTAFMAALLEPKPYTGKRGEHTDHQWRELIGPRTRPGFESLHRALAPYHALVQSVEACARRDLHDVRTAAISAIAADWHASRTTLDEPDDRTTFVGHPIEGGFILPPRRQCHPAFLRLLDAHRKAAGGPPLVWA